MSYFKVCPHCGAHLDPGERCDCRNEETARGATNTTDGKVEMDLNKDLSTSYDTTN